MAVTIPANSYPIDGSDTLGTTYVEYSIPAGLTELYVYLDDSTNDGEFSMQNVTAGRPLPKQTWVLVWKDAKNPGQANHTVYLKSGTASQTLHYWGW